MQPVPVSARVLARFAGPIGVLAYRGREVASGIDKHEQGGSVLLTTLGLAGDAQADARYHGGVEQALCVYPVEHYAEWAARLGRELPRPAFGENLLVEGLLEDEVCIGDVFELGPARVQVSQPRTPCYKPGVRNRTTRLKQWIKESGRSGWYLRVLDAGTITPDDTLVLVERRHEWATIREANRIRNARDPAGITRLLALPELGTRYQADLGARLRAATHSTS